MTWAWNLRVPVSVKVGGWVTFAMTEELDELDTLLSDGAGVGNVSCSVEIPVVDDYVGVIFFWVRRNSEVCLKKLAQGRHW
jgi:hypothetical protein